MKTLPSFAFLSLMISVAACGGSESSDTTTDGGKDTTPESATDAPADTPFACPTAAPRSTDACDWPATASCSFDDRCAPTPGGCKDAYRCVSGKLQTTSCTYAAACPATEPTAGSSCACGGSGHSAHHPGEVNGTAGCSYPCGGGVGTTNLKCDLATETWVMTGTCAAADAGP